MNSKKVCLVGLGNIGMVHLEAYLKLKNVDLTVVDTNTAIKEIAKKNSLKYFSDLKDALEIDFDLIDICTPTYLHYPQIKLCLENSKAVIFCEKPLVTSYKEAEELLKISKSKKRLILCAMVERFNDPFVRIKKELKKANGAYKIFLTRRTKKPLNNSWYEKESSGGGIVNDLGVHDIDLSTYLTNESIVDSSIKKNSGNKNRATISLKLSKGSIISIILRRDLPENCIDGVQNFCKVFLKKKKIISYSSDNDTLIINSAGRKHIKVNKRFPSAYYKEICEAIDTIKSKRNSNFPSRKQLLNCIQTIDCLNKKYEK